MGEGLTDAATSRGEPPALVDAEGKAAKPYRILHISDIHFGAHFDESVWEYVSALAERERPDLIACTGDVVDHGGLFMLAAARVELELLRRRVGEKTLLRCVPGNHDCGPFGNINVWPFSSNFASVFGPNAMDIPSKMPSYLAYRGHGWARRWLERVAFTPYLYLTRACVSIVRRWNSRSLYSLPILRSDDPSSLVLVYLDSNYTQRLASGSVNPKEVTLLKSRMLNLRDKPGGQAFVPRIAMVHHHPLPIPEASIVEGLTSFEPFLVLRNAGFVLRELSSCDVDLILHGHKHYSAFGRLGYTVDHKSEGEIAVLAAGSCGVTLSETGRNSVNLIDVFETGRMSYTVVYFGGGGGVAVNELFRNKRDVHGMVMHKARVHRRASERQGQWVAKVTHAVAVDAGGVAVVRHEINGHVFDRGLATDVVPVVIDVTMGRVTDTTLVLTEASKRAGHSWVDHPTSPQHAIKCGISLGQRLATSPPVDYGYQFVCFNTYAITEWETITACQRDKSVGRLRGRAPGLEFTSFVVRVPTRTLVIRLQLPADTLTTEPYVHVSRWSWYPDIPLDEARQFFDARPGEWTHDTDLTTHEAGNLVHIGSNAWELRVEFPLVGHRYDIRWRVEAPALTLAERREETSRRGRAESYRKSLLGDAALQGRLKNWAADLREWLLPHFKAHVPKADDVEIAAFVYDGETHSLRQVFSYPGPTQGAALLPLDVPLGEGVVGAAFKRSEFVMYIDPALTGSTDDAAYLYDRSGDAGGHPKWRFVAAFPVFALDDPFASLNGMSFDDWDPQSTVGVLTISSIESDSGLLNLTDDLQAAEAPVLVDSAPPPSTAQSEQADWEASSSTMDNGTPNDGQATHNGAASRPTAQEVWGLAHLMLEYVAESRSSEAPRLSDDQQL